MKKLKQIFCALLVTVFGVALLSACGNSKTTTAEWKEISFDELSADFAAREQAPWNHVEGTVVDGDKTYTIVEDLIDGKWVVDESKSTANRSLDWQSLTDSLITPADAMDSVNPANESSWQYKLYKKGADYKITGVPNDTSSTSSMEMIVDQYFYGTYMSSSFTYNTTTYSTVVNATWSVK